MNNKSLHYYNHVFNWHCVFLSTIPWPFLSCTSSSHSITGSLHGPLILLLRETTDTLSSGCSQLYSHIPYYTNETAITSIFQAYSEHSFQILPDQCKRRPESRSQAVLFLSGLGSDAYVHDEERGKQEKGWSLVISLTTRLHLLSNIKQLKLTQT